MPRLQDPTRKATLKYYRNHWQLYALFALPLVYYILFHYMPIYGALIAFKDFNAKKGILGSEWVGFRYVLQFLRDPYFFKVFRNTLVLNIFALLFGFPAPILFALLLNECKHGGYKRVVQSVSYLPHFISTVVVCGMIVNFLATQGVLNDFLAALGFERTSFLQRPQYFRTIYIASGVWQNVGWGAIIYLAALSGINTELYEAVLIEGANRLQKTIYVTLPGILPTISIMLILRIGSLMRIGFEKILLLYNGATFETADVIDTFVYRRGILGADFSYATAVGLFKSIVAMVLLVMANRFSKRFGETSLW